MPFRSDKRLYLNTDRSKVVDEDSGEAAYLLVAAGGDVSDQDAKRYGLTRQAKVEEEPVESKQIAQPPENKAVKMRSDKDEKDQ